MKDILEEIVAHKRLEVAKAKARLPERAIHAEVERMLGGYVPSMANALRESRSGISNPDTVKALRRAGYSGFLIGETFMRADDPGTALKEFVERTENL